MYLRYNQFSSCKIISFPGLYLGIVLILAAIGILITILILIMFHSEGQPQKNSYIIVITRSAANVICWKSHALRTGSDDKVSPMLSSAKMEVTSIVSRDKRNGVMLDVNSSKEDVKNHDNVDDTVTVEDSAVSWKVVAQVLDRFCFYFFLIITIAMNFSFVVALATGGHINGH